MKRNQDEEASAKDAKKKVNTGEANQPPSQLYKYPEASYSMPGESIEFIKKLESAAKESSSVDDKKSRSRPESRSSRHLVAENPTSTEIAYSDVVTESKLIIKDHEWNIGMKLEETKSNQLEPRRKRSKSSPVPTSSSRALVQNDSTGRIPTPAGTITAASTQQIHPREYFLRGTMRQAPMVVKGTSKERPRKHFYLDPPYEESSSSTSPTSTPAVRTVQSAQQSSIKGDGGDLLIAQLKDTSIAKELGEADDLLKREKETKPAPHEYHTSDKSVKKEMLLRLMPRFPIPGVKVLPSQPLPSSSATPRVSPRPKPDISKKITPAKENLMQEQAKPKFKQVSQETSISLRKPTTTLQRQIKELVPPKISTPSSKLEPSSEPPVREQILSKVPTPDSTRGPSQEPRLEEPEISKVEPRTSTAIPTIEVIKEPRIQAPTKVGILSSKAEPVTELPIEETLSFRTESISSVAEEIASAQEPIAQKTPPEITEPLKEPPLEELIFSENESPTLTEQEPKEELPSTSIEVEPVAPKEEEIPSAYHEELPPSITISQPEPLVTEQFHPQPPSKETDLLKKSSQPRYSATTPEKKSIALPMPTETLGTDETSREKQLVSAKPLPSEGKRESIPPTAKPLPSEEKRKSVPTPAKPLVSEETRKSIPPPAKPFPSEEKRKSIQPLAPMYSFKEAPNIQPEEPIPILPKFPASIEETIPALLPQSPEVTEASTPETFPTEIPEVIGTAKADIFSPKSDEKIRTSVDRKEEMKKPEVAPETEGRKGSFGKELELTPLVPPAEEGPELSAETNMNAPNALPTTEIQPVDKHEFEQKEVPKAMKPTLIADEEKTKSAALTSPPQAPIIEKKPQPIQPKPRPEIASKLKPLLQKSIPIIKISPEKPEIVKPKPDSKIPDQKAPVSSGNLWATAGLRAVKSDKDLTKLNPITTGNITPIQRSPSANNLLSLFKSKKTKSQTEEAKLHMSRVAKLVQKTKQTFETLAKKRQDAGDFKKLEQFGIPDQKKLVDVLADKDIKTFNFGSFLREYFSPSLRSFLLFNLQGRYRGTENTDCFTSIDLDRLGSKDEEKLLERKRKLAERDKQLESLRAVATNEQHFQFLKGISNMQPITCPITVSHGMLQETVPMLDEIFHFYINKLGQDHRCTIEAGEHFVRHRNRLNMYDNM